MVPTRRRTGGRLLSARLTSSETTADLFAPLRDAPARAAILTDFDGTLAPIVLDPAAAVALPGAVEVLHDLATRYRTVAVVSGRPVSFLHDRLRLDDADGRIVAYGLYGLQCTDGTGEAVDHPDALPWRVKVDDVAAAAERDAPDDVTVERKGLSVTLHVRTAPAEADWARSWTDTQAAVTGLVVHPGRMSYELRPPVDIDKGSIVMQLTDGVDAACFFGDDLGDLDAFDALERRQADGVHVVRVGVRSPEAPAELIERADLIVDGPAGVVELLKSL
jgi:trehalose 6-phosphate phosphatase